MRSVDWMGRISGVLLILFAVVLTVAGIVGGEHRFSWWGLVIVFVLFGVGALLAPRMRARRLGR